MKIRINNTTDQPIKANTGHVVEPFGAIDVTPSTWGRLQQDRYFVGQIRRGNITGKPVEAQREDGLTRSDIAKANRARLVDIITAQGDYTEADLDGITVEGREGEDGLRDLAAGLVFGDG